MAHHLGYRELRWTETFERALVIAFALMVANALVVSAPAMWTGWFVAGWVSRVGFALSVVALVGSVLWVAKSGPFRRVGWVVGGLCLAGQMMSAIADPSLSRIPGGWWGVQPAIVAGVVIVGCVGGRAGAVAFSVYIFAQAVILLVILELPSDGVGEPLWYLVVICMVAVMVAGIVPALRRTAALGDLAVQERIRAEVERESLLAATKSLRTVARLLHDAVAHALRACSLPPEAMSKGRVVDQCREALTALDIAAQNQKSTQRGLTERITEVLVLQQ